MRTTLNLDDEALANAMKTASGKTKTAVINEALRDYARRRELREILKFEGKLRWETNPAQRFGQIPAVADGNSISLGAGDRSSARGYLHVLLTAGRTMSDWRLSS